jgi:signal transduction histidine kinase
MGETGSGLCCPQTGLLQAEPYCRVRYATSETGDKKMSTAFIQVPSEIIHKWQELVNLIAEIVHVPSALVMKVEPPNIKVLVASESSGNPYEQNELAPLDTGLYCETVMKTRQLLLVPDALRDDEWKSNPDIKLGMISYLGLPIAWPDGEIFGTICVLDKKENAYDGLYRKFLLQCRDVLQADLTSLAKASKDLTRSEAYLEEAQRLSRTGSFGWKVSTGEIVWSKESFRIFEYDETAPITPDMVLQRVHPEDRALVQRTLERASRSGRDFDHEHRLLMPDGSVKHVHFVAHAVKDDVGQLEFIGAVMDLTAARRVEEEMHQARSELAHVARVTSLGVLTASIAHEVNQPLAAIITNGESSLRWLARPQPEVGKVRELTARVVADARRASEIIDRIRAMATRRAPEPTLLSLDDIIAETMVFLRHELQSKSVSVSLDLAPALPQVVGDRTQLQQVVVNLAINAVQAMAQSRAARRSIFVRTMLSNPETVCCSIEDSGPGIDPTHLPRLFDSFFTTKDTGMGMGLPICRSIIEAHDGTIGADNDSSLGGARFSFALPANEVRAD